MKLNILIVCKPVYKNKINKIFSDLVQKIFFINVF